LPPPWQSQDIGPVGLAGSASVSGGTFTLNGSGADIWGGADQLNYVYQRLTGDVTIVARVVSVGNTHPWAKTGVMIRETLDPSSRNALMALTPGNGLDFQKRLTSGGGTSRSATAGVAPRWVKLVRSGNNFTGYQSSDGTTWTQVGTTTITMTSSVYAGLAVSSHDNTVLCNSIFDGVSATVP
jgi:hypothetical protein